jgi:hypothetical protein
MVFSTVQISMPGTSWAMAAARARSSIVAVTEIVLINIAPP